MKGVAGKLDGAWVFELVILGKLPGEDSFDAATRSVVVTNDGASERNSLFADGKNIG